MCRDDTLPSYNLIYNSLKGRTITRLLTYRASTRDAAVSEIFISTMCSVVVLQDWTDDSKSEGRRTGAEDSAPQSWICPRGPESPCVAQERVSPESGECRDVITLYRQERQQSIAEEDELEDLDNMTSDIKDWLTSTFATKQQVCLRPHRNIRTEISNTADKKVGGGPDTEVGGQRHQDREVSGEDLQQHVLQACPHIPRWSPHQTGGLTYPSLLSLIYTFLGCWQLEFRDIWLC